jgi:hypothetical protein
MRVGVIQSNYLPWRGYFDFIDDVDLFVVHDDLQFTKGDWRNRNRIKTPQGARWITVPVHHRHSAQLICETAIDYSRDWQRDHRNLITANFRKAPYLDDVLALVEPELAAGHATISDLNVALLTSICRYLDITTPLRMSSSLHLTKTRTERLIELLTRLKATTYVSGPSARAYLDEARFREAGLALEYKQYVYQPYPQLWGAFDGALSVIDTIANCGLAARQVLKSATEVAVPGGPQPERVAA